MHRRFLFGKSFVDIEGFKKFRETLKSLCQTIQRRQIFIIIRRIINLSLSHNNSRVKNEKGEEKRSRWKIRQFLRKKRFFGRKRRWILKRCLSISKFVEILLIEKGVIFNSVVESD